MGCLPSIEGRYRPHCRPSRLVPRGTSAWRRGPRPCQTGGPAPRVRAMSDTRPLRVVIVKPAKYRPDGTVERFRRGFMPNATLPYLRSLTPDRLGSVPVEVVTIDEYVETDLGYLEHLKPAPGRRTLVALAGVQSHQLHRALDLAALARRNGVGPCVLGGPHPMTCDTSALEGRGVSFARAEAEVVWPEILDDARRGELKPVYGEG